MLRASRLLKPGLSTGQFGLMIKESTDDGLQYSICDYLPLKSPFAAFRIPPSLLFSLPSFY